MNIFFSLPYTYSLSELSECRMPLAIRSDVIDQILAIAMHPVYYCITAKVLVEIIVNLAHSPETHPYIVTREIAEKLLEVCDQRHKMVIQWSTLSQQRRKEDPMIVSVLKYAVIVTSCYHNIIARNICRS